MQDAQMIQPGDEVLRGASGALRHPVFCVLKRAHLP
jgi:hypothetical protein